MPEVPSDADPSRNIALQAKWSAAGHVIQKAVETLDWKLGDLTEFAKRLQLIEYGLTAETEFAAVLSWLGRCSVVHGLDQDSFSSHGKDPSSIPDLLAIIEHLGKKVPMLIEVKTTKNEVLKLPTRKFQAMRDYAAMLSLPLLFAWKPRRLGFWLLVDAVHFREDGNKSILELEPAAQNDLLSSVAGDFLLIPKPKVGLVLEATMVKKTKVEKSYTEGIAKITGAGFRDATGMPAKNVPPAIIAMIFSCMELVDDFDGDVMRKSFLTGEESTTRAQQVLRSAVAWRSQDQKPIRWRHVAKELGSYLSRDELDDAVKKSFGTFVQYQLLLVPKEYPAFVPPEWRHSEAAAEGIDSVEGSIVPGEQLAET